MSNRDYVFGKEMPFEKACPELEDAIVEYKQYMFPSIPAGKELPQQHRLRRDGGLIGAIIPAALMVASEFILRLRKTTAVTKPKSWHVPATKTSDADSGVAFRVSSIGSDLFASLKNNRHDMPNAN